MSLKSFRICWVFFVFLLLTSCTSRHEESGNDRENRKVERRTEPSKKRTSKDAETFSIHDINGNELTVKNRRYKLIIELIGVNNTRDVERYIQENLSEPLRIVTDSKHEPRRKVNGIRFPAYVLDQFGNCINSSLIKEKISGINEEFLYDSLYEFKKYAAQAQVPEVVEVEEEKDDDDFSIDELRQATFKVENYDKYGNAQGMGSGFFVSSSGYGVSNHHVFDGGMKWRIFTCGEEKVYTIEPDDIIGWSEPLDYIVFKLNTTDELPFLPISKSIPEQGDDIFVYGNPKGLTCTLTKGVVSAIRDKYGDNEYIQIDAAISPGSSGSPIINKKGEVVAIATMKQLDCENCNFGMNIEVIKEDYPY